MKATKFIHEYLGHREMITIADLNGNILYEGTPLAYPVEAFEGVDIANITTGANSDIIITIKDKPLNTYRVTITEVLSRNVDVLAVSYDEAEEKVRQAYRKAKVVLDEGDFQGVEFTTIQIFEEDEL